MICRRSLATLAVFFFSPRKKLRKDMASAPPNRRLKKPGFSAST
jgi:hypothetical protein